MCSIIPRVHKVGRKDNVWCGKEEGAEPVWWPGAALQRAA